MIMFIQSRIAETTENLLDNFAVAAQAVQEWPTSRRVIECIALQVRPMYGRPVGRFCPDVWNEMPESPF
jgi:hypothetical protein